MTTTSRLTLPPQPSSVSAARRFVTDVLTALDADGATEDAATLVSELATNAVLHAKTPFTIEVELDAGALRIGVIDLSPAVPRVRDYGSTATTGRGMRLVAAMAARWGVLRSDNGKTVWFELPAQGVSEQHGWDDDTDAEVLLGRFTDADDVPPASPEARGLAA